MNPTKPKTQFLIQRLRDGLFYRNRTYHQRRYSLSADGVDDEWTANPSECKPFKSPAGAKTSAGWCAYRRVRSTKPCPLCSSGEEHDERYYRHWEYIKLAENELPQRIVPCAVSVGLVSEKTPQ